MDYLASYAEFYQGEDFLLTASVWQNQLNGMELLGNTAAAPGILSALGIETGTFRTPGGNTPTAMSRPLKNNVKMPEYMAFFFD